MDKKGPYMNDLNTIEYIEHEVALKWRQILDQSLLSDIIKNDKFDKRLYAIYLIETYHYTLHNSRNQALVAVNLPPSADIQYLKFCLKHAYEEAGHELMAFHDLNSLGLTLEIDALGKPLPTTEFLIAYLYRVSSTGNLNSRLGYSLWAENAYEHIGELLGHVKNKLNLKPSQMTFLGEHSEIDAKHILEVRKMIKRVCKTSQDWSDLLTVAINSLELTGQMLNEVASEYNQLKSGKNLKYNFLNALV